MNTRIAGAQSGAMRATFSRVVKRLAQCLAAMVLLWVITANGASEELSDIRACREGNSRCTQMAINEMERQYRRLANNCSHEAIFSYIYLQTTRTFLDTLNTIGYNDPASVVRQDGLFADYYFRAYDAYHKGDHMQDVPPAWRIAFDTAAGRKVTAMGDGLLGINAHIQRDLAFTLYQLDLEGHPISHEDHTLVDNFLAQVMVDDEIRARFDPTFDEGGDPSAMLQLLFAWREQAYTNYLSLRDAPTAEARAAVAAGIENAAVETANAIIQQTAYPPGTNSASRDEFCSENPR